MPIADWLIYLPPLYINIGFGLGFGKKWKQRVSVSWLTVNEVSIFTKKFFFKFREYVSRTLLQGLQPPTKVSLILNRFPKTLGSALLSLSMLKNTVEALNKCLDSEGMNSRDF